MNTQEVKRVLKAKATELSARVTFKDEIAIEQSAEMLDEIQRTMERELALETAALKVGAVHITS